MKDLDNRFYVKFMQLWIGLLKIKLPLLLLHDITVFLEIPFVSRP